MTALGKKNKIMVVDDSPVICDFFQEVLENDYTVKIAPSGSQVFKHLKSESLPDLILLDIMMEGMDGHEICKRLKAEKSFRDIPVIFITIKGGIEDEKKGLELGAVDYLTKPISPAILKARLRTHIELNQHRKKLKKQLAQSEKMATLGLLVSGISHEINNPNNFIMFNLPIIRKYLEELMPIIDDYAAPRSGLELFGLPYPEFRQEIFKLLDNMEHGTSRINTTITRLKEFASPNPLRIQSTKLSEIIEKGVALCRKEVEKTVKSFSVKMPKNQPLVYTDPMAIEQIIINLLINASRAADKEDSWVKLIINFKDNWLEHLIIEVQDNGRGIDEEIKPRIFEPFVSTNSSGSGTGLGLFICHNLIEELGGRIEAYSEPGQITIFRVILPEITSDSKVLT
jgi:signal transduction histidine kinase